MMRGWWWLAVLSRSYGCWGYDIGFVPHESVLLGGDVLDYDDSTDDDFLFEQNPPSPHTTAAPSRTTSATNDVNERKHTIDSAEHNPISQLQLLSQLKSEVRACSWFSNLQNEELTGQNAILIKNISRLFMTAKKQIGDRNCEILKLKSQLGSRTVLPPPSLSYDSLPRKIPRRSWAPSIESAVSTWHAVGGEETDALSLNQNIQK